MEFWVILSLAGALFQALEFAIKKKLLQSKGLNNLTACLAFIGASLIFWLMYISQSDGIFWFPDLSLRFWNGMFWSVFLNVLAVWFFYRAIDLAELSYLSPFMALTSLSMIVPPMFILGEMPTLQSFVGIGVVVIGAMLIDFKPHKKEENQTMVNRNNKKGKLYFSMTALCYTFAPTALKVAVVESSPIFTSFLSHLLIGVSFILFIFLFKEKNRINELCKNKIMRKRFFIGIVLAAIAIAAANGSINFALKIADVSNVMAIKRVMPIFALLIGIFYFKEKKDLLKKFIATIIMIIGAILITLS